VSSPSPENNAGVAEAFPSQFFLVAPFLQALEQHAGLRSRTDIPLVNTTSTGFHCPDVEGRPLDSLLLQRSNSIVKECDQPCSRAEFLRPFHTKAVAPYTIVYSSPAKGRTDPPHPGREADLPGFQEFLEVSDIEPSAITETVKPIEDPKLYALEVILRINPVLCIDTRGRTLFAPDQHVTPRPLSSRYVKTWIAEKVYHESNKKIVLTNGQINAVVMVLMGTALRTPAPAPQVVPDLEGRPDLLPLADLDALLEAVFFFMREKPHYENSGENVLKDLTEAATELGLDTQDEFWPKSASILSRRLGSISADLESIRTGDQGSFRLRIFIGKKNGKRFIRVAKLPIQDGRDGNV
jgi:hypothetical protein